MIRYLSGDFEKEIIDKRILVDFYADWCGPCRMMGQILEDIDGIDILKVDVDKYSLIAQKYSVMSIPTLILFENGNKIKSNVGLISEEMINDFINN